MIRNSKPDKGQADCGGVHKAGRSEQRDSGHCFMSGEANRGPFHIMHVPIGFSTAIRLS